METAVIVKEDGAKQRIDVGLTKAIADTLGQLIAAGTTLYPSKGKKGLVLEVGEEENKQTVSLSAGQISSWLQRGTVIPETGENLRTFLDGKRDEKRIQDSQARQTTIRENAEKQLQALTGIEIKPQEVKQFYKYDHRGKKSLVREEVVTGSAKLAEVVVKGLVFGLERLDPARYGSKAEVQHNHFVFDLARLRQARKQRDALKGDVIPQ